MKIKNPLFILLIHTLFIVSYSSCQSNGSGINNSTIDSSLSVKSEKKSNVTSTDTTKVDTAEYDRKMLALCNGDSSGLWPAKGPYPLAGAIFPYSRVVAFYGNLYSKKMGILGELPKDSMLKK